jgi:hypothetical protein
MAEPGAPVQPDSAGGRPRCDRLALRAAGSRLGHQRPRRSGPPAVPHCPRRAVRRSRRGGMRPGRRAVPTTESAGQSRRSRRRGGGGLRHGPESRGVWRPAGPRAACTARYGRGRDGPRPAGDARYAVRGVRRPAAFPGRGVIGREGHHLRCRQRRDPARTPAGRAASLRIPAGGDARRRPGDAPTAGPGNSRAWRP